MPTPLIKALTQDQEDALRDHKYHHWVDPNTGKVICKDPDSDTQAMGRSIRLAFEALERKLKS